tara:strand:- start:1162 stop:1602 length:441 start_codon:yes stop_codon:yes gene_type:complete
MSAEKEMNMIETLSEELGEKELKIMALEKELEEEKKEKLEYYDLSLIRLYKLTHFEDMVDVEGQALECWSPEWLIDNEINKYDGPDINLLEKVLLYYFDGSIMTKEEIIEELDDFGDSDWEQFISDHFSEVIDLDDDKYWVVYGVL